MGRMTVSLTPAWGSIFDGEGVQSMASRDRSGSVYSGHCPCPEEVAKSC